MKVEKTVGERFIDFLFDWEDKIQLLIGGYGSGKSYHIALKLVLKLLKERRTCLVVREVYATIRESCFILLQEICAGLRLENQITFARAPMQITFQNGSRIIFRGMDNPQKLKSIHDISLIWVEECSEIRYSGFKELLGRLRHPSLKLHIVLSTNPTSKSNWVYEYFFKKQNINDDLLYRQKELRAGGIFYHHTTALDNRFLPEEYVRQLEEMKKYDPDLYRVARLGRFGVNGQKVLPQFEVANHEEVMRAVENISRRRRYCGLDFGFVESYNACIKVAVDAEVKVLYIYWEWYERGLTDDEIVERLADLIETREVVRCDSAEPKTIKYLQKNGIKAIGCKKFAGSKLYNIRKVKRFHKIVCSTECVNCIKELADLTFATDRNGTLIEDEFNVDSHCFDAIAYAIEPYDVTDLKYKFRKSDLGL